MMSELLILINLWIIFQQSFSVQFMTESILESNSTSLPTSIPTSFPTYIPTSAPTTVPTLNYNTASEVMGDLKGKYKKILRAGLNVAWKSNSNVEVEINNTNPVGNISYMVLEIYDDDDCSKPVMQAG